MDKYTVDLDQVLNDLEYSELTDQHDKNKVNNIQNSSTSYVHNNFKNTNIKHSINNVFHSLNEYLNTDISTKCEYKPTVQEPSFSADSWKLQNLNTPSEQNDVASSTEIPDKVVETLPSLDLPEQADLTVNECESEDILVDTVLNNHDHKPQEILTDEIMAIAEEKTVVRSPDYGKNDILIVEEKVLVDTDELTENTETFKVEDVTNNLEAGTGLENAVEIETNSETSITHNIGTIETQLDTAVSEEDTSIEEEEIVKDEVENNTLDEKIGDGLIKVGFEDGIDLDDSDLNQYLDQVEQEYNTLRKVEYQPAGENKDQECSDKVETEEERTQPELNDESLDEASSARPNKLPLVTPKSGDIKSVIDLVGEPGSTPYNNVYVNKELTQEKHKDNSDTDYSTSASPTFSDISTETNSSCTPSTDTVNDADLTGAGDETSKSDDTVIEAVTKNEDNAVQNISGENIDVEVNGDGARSERELTETKAETPGPQLGNEAPLWIPDAEALSCMHCDTKFTVIKRRHHCRACGYVLCSKCCNLRYRLEYLEDVARVCNQCYEILSKDGAINDSRTESNSPHFMQPNPNNPLEYCSTLPPHQQVSGNTNPPAVMVPVGVLKRKGSNKARTNKSVMFCDGIRPGSDLTNLDSDFAYTEKSESKTESNAKVNSDRCFVVIEPETNSFIPKGDDLPPTVTLNKTDILYSECSNGHHVVEMLKNETLMFALQTSLFVYTKIINMDCCINKLAWCFSTEGLINVGQDEIVIILELLDDEKTVPKDIFLHINSIYQEALKGTSVKELGISLHYTSNFLGSKNHAGFVYIRPTFQCVQNVIKPQEPYLIGILIHRWETPWAKLFPLRLILRLGAEYRYYPSPLISNRYRDSVFVEIGHTIINLLADFRNFSYTLPQIRGLTIHMEDKNTTIRIPSNRYDQVLKSMNNSSDHILAFAGNFSSQADSHLVCIQDTQSNENAYSTHAINIHNKPRKVTGASFIVFNGALKSSSGLTAKSSIVEDGLMIQIPSEQMVQVRESLRNMKNFTIQCGCINAASDETVNIEWGEADINFNLNVCSPIDNKSMEGIPSIRVHNGKDYTNGNRLIRWTEVFIIQNEGEVTRNQDPIDISKVSETIAKATCTALVKYLDLLVSNNFYKIGIRTNLNAYFVAYSAGSNATILPPIYMESLDNELVPVLHRNATNDCDENTIILELIFRILNK